MTSLALHSTRVAHRRASHLLVFCACVLLGAPATAGAVMRGNPTPGQRSCDLGGKSYEHGKTVVVTLADGKTKVTLRCVDGSWEQARPDAATAIQYEADTVYEDASGAFVVSNPRWLSGS